MSVDEEKRKLEARAEQLLTREDPESQLMLEDIYERWAFAADISR